MIVVKLIEIAFGRPSVAKAVLWSLGLHASAVVATIYPWSKTTDQITLAGIRNIVQVEAAFSAERPEPVEEMEVTVEPKPVPTEPTELVVEPLLVAVTRPIHQTPVDQERVFDGPLVDPQPTIQPKVIRHETNAPIEDPTSPPPREILRSKVEVHAPRTSIRAEQIAGVDDTTPPDFHGNPPPAYPTAAISQGREGTVLLRLFIASTGSVQRVEIVISSGHGILDRAAVEAVSKWQGSPAFHAGVPSPTEELLPIRFRL